MKSIYIFLLIFSYKYIYSQDLVAKYQTPLSKLNFSPNSDIQNSLSRKVIYNNVPEDSTDEASLISNVDIETKE